MSKPTTKKLYYLIIRHLDTSKEYVSSYPDECIARQYMMRDIVENYLNGNINQIHIYGPNITYYKSDNITWKILEGWYTEKEL